MKTTYFVKNGLQKYEILLKKQVGEVVFLRNDDQNQQLSVFLISRMRSLNTICW